MESEVCRRRKHHTSGIDRVKTHQKGESGVSENDVCECGSIREAHSLEWPGDIKGECRAFSLDRHGVSEEKGVEVCECGHSAASHNATACHHTTDGEYDCPCAGIEPPTPDPLCKCGHPRSAHYLGGGEIGREPQSCSFDCKCPSYRHEPEESPHPLDDKGMGPASDVKECWIEQRPDGMFAGADGTDTEFDYHPQRVHVAFMLKRAGFTIIPNPNEGEGDICECGAPRKNHDPGEPMGSCGVFELRAETNPIEADERAEFHTFPHEIVIAIEIWNILRPLDTAARGRIDTIINCMKDGEYAAGLEGK